MTNIYAYICDLKKCSNCSYPVCFRTTDINHSVTKAGSAFTEMKLIWTKDDVNYYEEILRKATYGK